MSYTDGWAAIHMEMPPRVPRTEYSLELHYGVMKTLLGLDISADTPAQERGAAERALRKRLNYDFIWNVLTGAPVFGEKRTRMGHANYQSGGTDYDDTQSELYTDPEEALRFDPWALYGARDTAQLTAEYDAHYAALLAAGEDLVQMTGIYVTCISGLIEIFGWNMLLLACGEDPKAFGAVTERYCDWIAQYFEALAESKAPVVMIHDDFVWTSGGFLHPDWYRRYVFPNYKRLFAPLRDAGKRILFTADGGYTEYIDDVAACGVHSFVMEPATDMAQIAERYGRTHGFVGNADTRILLSGKKEDIEAEVKRCMDIGKRCPGFFLAVGNHIPPNTPVENFLIYNDAYERLSRR